MLHGKVEIKNDKNQYGYMINQIGDVWMNIVPDYFHLHKINENKIVLRGYNWMHLAHRP